MDGFEATYLEPANVRFFHGSRGVLEGEIAGQFYKHLSLTRAFPLAMANLYLAVLSHEDKEPQEIGMLRRLDELDEDSRLAAERALMLHYVVPTITRIDTIKQETAFWRWKVQTNRGPATLIMRNIHDHVRVLSSDRLLITDVDGRRFELPDVQELDGHSRGLIRRYL